MWFHKTFELLSVWAVVQKGILVPMCFLCTTGSVSRMIWLKIKPIMRMLNFLAGSAHEGHRAAWVLVPSKEAQRREHSAHFGTPGLRSLKATCETLELGMGEWEMPVTFKSSSLLRSFQASFNKQPKVLVVGHPCRQHPPPQLFICYP